MASTPGSFLSSAWARPNIRDKRGKGCGKNLGLPHEDSWRALSHIRHGGVSHHSDHRHSHHRASAQLQTLSNRKGDRCADAQVDGFHLRHGGQETRLVDDDLLRDDQQRGLALGAPEGDGAVARSRFAGHVAVIETRSRSRPQHVGRSPVGAVSPRP